ncbi:MYXO-CTERM sorting domain-containing protein [Nannocystis sp. ILAH1]|uniref:MYXO-CTERM sorting domain-containing protein n=1 Tax=unclassified Nannocystis TaxID=2627009 RepID=UPI0022706128|nr:MULTISPECIES: MYXO-CTERM sorting domain-containing protein [unclassified Nannocystis]MCY0986761.1 MYXO-CTERM sorting domain-containing protein [Nannocystis sp. ILAH1]MCY1071640.1 MYXO-CTERM sorting domain-containing protein [Nannocystis sp. RBIL2]
MRSFGLICSALLLATAPASAAALDTDTDTDTGFEPHPPPEVDILSPDDGAVFDGTPDAVVPVEISYSYMQPGDVSLWVDDVEVAVCDHDWWCTFEVTLSPGVHKLQGFGSGFESEVVMVEVRDGSSGDSSGGSSGGSTGTEGSETATDGDSDSDGKGGGEKSGCGCSAGHGGLGAWGLGLLGLLALRRRQAG